MRTYLPLLMVAIFIAACLPPNLVDDLPGPGLLVQADWLSNHIDRSDVMIVHVASERDHYNEGHLPGASFLHLSSILDSPGNQVNILPDADVVKTAFESAGVSNRSHVILYGDMGGLAATRAFYTLDVFGHDRVSILDGGRDAWEAIGLSLEVDAHEPEIGSFNPEYNDQVVVDADWVNEHRTQHGYALLDARPRDQYTGDTPGENISRPGHIPDARNLFWQSTLLDGTVPTFREENELASMLSEAGFNDGDTIVAYCRTGIQASHAYFLARLLGQSVRMYDASFHDWSNNTEYPVDRG